MCQAFAKTPSRNVAKASDGIGKDGVECTRFRQAPPENLSLPSLHRENISIWKRKSSHAVPGGYKLLRDRYPIDSSPCMYLFAGDAGQRVLTRGEVAILQGTLTSWLRTLEETLSYLLLALNAAAIRPKKPPKIDRRAVQPTE